METRPLALLHFADQSASVLLAPVVASLADLEARLSHYLERVPIVEADRPAIVAARAAMERARREIEALGAR